MTVSAPATPRGRSLSSASHPHRDAGGPGLPGSRLWVWLRHAQLPAPVPGGEFLGPDQQVKC